MFKDRLSGLPDQLIDVRSVVIPDTGHWVAEEAPRQVLAALTTFLAPYRDQARNTQSRATAMPGN